MHVNGTALNLNLSLELSASLFVVVSDRLQLFEGLRDVAAAAAVVAVGGRGRQSLLRAREDAIVELGRRWRWAIFPLK